MTTRCINVSQREAAALHKGEATAIVRRMREQPIMRRFYGLPHAMPWMPIGGVYRSKWECPYGRVGDVLLCRETWQAWHKCSHEYDEWEAITAEWLKDGGRRSFEEARQDGLIDSIEFKATSESCGPWRSAATMPYWAVRTRRVVAAVEPIRAAEMTEEQARALGHRGGSGPDYYSTSTYEARHHYESIHGEGSWAKDWVWFLRLERSDG